MLSPSFGVIADRRMIKTWWLRILTYLGAGATIVLLALWTLVTCKLSMDLVATLFHCSKCRIKWCRCILQSLLPHMGMNRNGFNFKQSLCSRLSRWRITTSGSPRNGFDFTDYGNWVIPFVMATSGMWWLGFAQ